MGLMDNLPPMSWPGGPSVFNGGGQSSKPAPAPTPSAKKSNKKAAAAAPVARKKKDMTWGGRPDPAPESYVEEKPGLFSKGWRLGKKSKK